MLSLLLVTACYTASTPAGLPCSADGACPKGQHCVSGAIDVCQLDGAASPAPDASPDSLLEPLDGGLEPIDGAPDSPPVAADSDGDGVPDDRDNCPGIANSDQANEDMDRFGDACDPCPPDANDTPGDPDGDGVADACDPNPSVPGDHIELFESFHGDLPPTWIKDSGWQITGDTAHVMAAADFDEILVAPITSTVFNPGRVSATASVVVEAMVGSGVEHGIDLSVVFDATRDLGVDCSLFQPGNAASERTLLLFDDFQGRDINVGSFGWRIATEYRISMTRRDRNFICSAVEPDGTLHSAQGTSPSSVSMSGVALRGFSINAHVSWLLIVTSP